MKNSTSEIKATVALANEINAFTSEIRNEFLISNFILLVNMEKWKALLLLVKTIKGPTRQASFIYDRVAEIEKIDSKKESKSMRNKIIGFFIFMRNKEGDLDLHALVCYYCALAHIDSHIYEDHGDIVGFKGFDKENHLGLFDPWVRKLFNQIILIGNKTILEEVFNKELQLKIFSRVEPELRRSIDYSMDNDKFVYQYHESSFENLVYLSQLVDCIMDLKNENQNLLFMKPNCEFYNEAKSSLEGMSVCLKAIECLHESMLFAFACNKQEIKRLVEGKKFSGNLIGFCEYYFCGEGVDLLYRKKWFQDKYGAKELPLNS